MKKAKNIIYPRAVALLCAIIALAALLCSCNECIAYGVKLVEEMIADK